MSASSIVRNDILSEELKTPRDRVKVIAEQQFVTIVNNATKFEGKQTTVRPAKEIVEVMSLVKNAFDDYYSRAHTSADAQVVFSYEEPDKAASFETVTIKLTRREPGAFGQGRPWENELKACRPIVREELEDVDNPGYKRVILGQWYDNEITLTAWSRTNKAANDRALWIENLMEEYAWYFAYMGCSRAPVYQGRGEERTINVDGNKFYGRPIKYYVRTEKLRTVSQKELEQVIVRLALEAPV